MSAATRWRWMSHRCRWWARNVPFQVVVHRHPQRLADRAQRVHGPGPFVAEGADPLDGVVERRVHCQELLHGERRLREAGSPRVLVGTRQVAVARQGHDRRPRVRVEDRARDVDRRQAAADHGDDVLVGHRVEGGGHPGVEHHPRIVDERVEVAEAGRQLQARRQDQRVGGERVAGREPERDTVAVRCQPLDGRTHVTEDRAGRRDGVGEHRLEIASVVEAARKRLPGHVHPATEVVEVVGERAHREGRHVEAVPRVPRGIGHPEPQLGPGLDDHDLEAGAAQAQQVGCHERPGGPATGDRDPARTRGKLGAPAHGVTVPRTTDAVTT